MRHLDLFSGIGGNSLAASWVWPDHETVSFCEIDPFCQAILRKHWPEVPIHDDVRTLRGDAFGQIDLITAGWPCQPFSVAGKRRGKDDDRHLWPQVRRIVAEARPCFLLGENVPGIINMELDNVLADLESLGYTARPIVIPACSVGAPHRRDRVWIVGYAECPERGADSEPRGNSVQRQDRQRQTSGGTSQSNRSTADPRSTESRRLSSKWRQAGTETRSASCSDSNPQVTRLEGPEGSPRAGRCVEQHADDVADTANGDGRGRERGTEAGTRQDGIGRGRFAAGCDWSTPWPEVATRLCGLAYGVSERLAYALRGLGYGTPDDSDRSKDMSALRQAFLTPEIRATFGGLYQIHDTEVLLEALCGIPWESYQKWIDATCDEVEERFLRELWDHREARRASCGWRHSEQLAKQHQDALPHLSYEASLALAEAWHRVRYAQETDCREGFQRKGWRNAALKAIGNSIVPQVAAEVMSRIASAQGLFG